jgi:hypothetical protein
MAKQCGSYCRDDHIVAIIGVLRLRFVTVITEQHQRSAMVLALRAIGLVALLLVVSGCGEPNQQQPLHQAEATPGPYPPPPNAAGITVPGDVLEEDVDVTQDGEIVLINGKLEYISGYQDGWRECCRLHKLGQLNLNDERVEPVVMVYAPEPYVRGWKEGFKACRQMLLQKTTS